MTAPTTRHFVPESIVFGMGVFILFILAFEQRLSIPLWLQPFGRMHPLILHLPIALLFIASVMEFLHAKKDRDSEHSSYGQLAGHLLLGGVLTTGLAVIMGIFLAREDGYTQEALQAHKWTGVAVFFLSAALYSVRRLSWYYGTAAKVGAVATTVCLVITGHLGGSVTHGENFVWEPVLATSEARTVPLEEAQLFPHVVQPLLDSKCVSCHNPEKKKGKLLLTNEEAVRQGGKSGPLFVAGLPDSSLLLQRIRLPLDHKKHMPPSGKPQLTDAEREVLYHWIRSGYAFETKVVELSESDSLRIATVNFLHERDGNREAYTFPPASQATLRKLNSNYRVIRPVARNSPAVTVNLYNREVYTPRTLDELREVRIQIISLDLSKMPVKDDDLKLISRLENLRTLNLNFTDISGMGLQFLRDLKHLEELSLTGTRVTYSELQKALSSMKALREVALWDTPVSQEEVALLERRLPNVSFIAFSGHGRALIKLNPPRIKNKYRVFRDSLALELFHPVRGTDIRFTFDGKEPDSLSSPSFPGRMLINKTAAITARAYKDGWLTSDVATLHVYRSSHPPDTAILRSTLNRVHTANGAMTFFDGGLGGFNANSPAWANNWAGFINNDMVLYAYYDNPVRLSSISLNTLIEPETSIFPPEVIEVWGGPSEERMTLIARKRVDLPKAYRKPYIQLHDVTFQERGVACLKIIARPVMKLGAWHKKKGKPALMLIDEILVN